MNELERLLLDRYLKEICKLCNQSFTKLLLSRASYWKRPWCWEILRADGEEGNRGWNGWIASLIQWTWTWAYSRRRWGIGKSGVLQSMGSHRIRHDLAAEQQQYQECRSFSKLFKLFFKYKFIYFNCRLITLQYCIGFAIHWHESTTGVHVFPILKSLPPPSPSHPSGSSQCTNPEHPVSCIEPALAIHFTYDNIHVSMPFSQTIPPLSSPTESKRLLYTSVSLLKDHLISKKSEITSGF